ncbi:MAG: restriction endonuclease subunit S [Nitrosomonadales bacterium]|nr:restriction endonuclease subunit S [Nitrosomonadales bacterium]
MSWSVLRLDEVAEVVAGNPAPQESGDFVEDGYLFIRMQDVGREHRTADLRTSTDRVGDESVSKYRLRLFPVGSVLIPKSGASVNLNHRAMLGCEAYVVSHLAVIVPNKEKLLPEYLYYWSLSYDPRSQAQTTSLPSLPLSLIKAALMPMPPLSEQRRIVDILSRAEGIVRLRRDAEKKAAELIPALFLDMFGDPATNPKGWTTAPFGAIGTLDRGKSRHRPRDAAELYGGAYPFIQTGDVANSGGRITGYTTTYSELGLAQSRLWPRGTLCITIAANIAKTGVLDFDSCFPDSVVGFLPGELVRTEYVQSWLGFLQPTLEANAPQAAQKNINLEILRNLPVPVPPLDLQNVFDQRCAEIFSIQTQQTTATAKAQATFDALLAQVFG